MDNLHLKLYMAIIQAMDEKPISLNDVVNAVSDIWHDIIEVSDDYQKVGGYIEPVETDDASDDRMSGNIRMSGGTVNG